MAKIELLRTPSVPIAPKKRCRFGVKRNGTLSECPNSGLDELKARSRSAFAYADSDCELTGQSIGCKDIACSSRERDSGRTSTTNAEDIGHENERGKVGRHLFSNVPEICRCRHRTMHIL